MTSSLTFAALRAANTSRLPLFRNPLGEPAHARPDGSDWSLGDWCTATIGELGEAANILKKIRRGDLTLEQARPALAAELADVQCYLDHLASQAGIDLGEATVAKWNAVSERCGIGLRLRADDGLAAVAKAAAEHWWPDRLPRDFGERQLCAALIRAFGAGTREGCQACAEDPDGDVREGCDECPSQASIDRFLAEADAEREAHASTVQRMLPAGDDGASS